MTSIIGIPTTRLSDLFIRQRLLDQTQYDQLQLFRLQTQLSTGHRFQLPSEDPIASASVMNLQRLLEFKSQVQRNLATNQSYLSSTEVAMSSIADIVSQVRAEVLGAIGTAATDDQRAAALQQVQQAIRQLMDIGNQKFRGRYLFTGSNTLVEPFALNGNLIEYFGNEAKLYSFSDTDLLFETNVTGSEVFGAVSQVVRGSADLDPVLRFDTRLADLRGGRGIKASAIEISDGRNSTLVDLSAAETIGDVALMIRNHPPPGRTLDVEVTQTGLKIRLVRDPSGLSAENLTIREVGGGTTAAELGILNKNGVGNEWLIGEDLDPALRATTSLDDILGRRARAVVRIEGTDNDFLVEADVSGSALNGVKIVFENDPLVTAGSERVEYTPGELKIFIDEGYTKAHHVVEAIHKAHLEAGLPFDAWLDPLDDLSGGQALIQATPPGEYAAITDGGKEPPFDRTSGIQILNGGAVHTFEFSDARTIEDLLNALNHSSAGVLAAINADGTGIDVRSRLSGNDFAIGENGGLTATQLGLRTFLESTQLSELNYGAGVQEQSGGAQASTIFQWAGPNNDMVFTARSYGAAWNNVTITFVNTGTRAVSYDRNARTLTIEIDGTTTANDVLQMIAASEEVSADFEVALRAEAGQPNSGQGLVGAATQSTDGGSDDGVDFTITRSDGVTLAIDIAGCVSIRDVLTRINHHPDNTPLVPGGPPALEARLVAFGNGIELVDQSGGAETLTLTKALTSQAAVDLGLIPKGAESVQGKVVGSSQVIQGTDVNPKETEGIFTALLRIEEGLKNGDLVALQRAMQMLDAATLRATLVRAELGARQQGLDVLQDRLETEDVELQSALSLEYDADFIEVVSQLAARQAAFQASMIATGKIFEMSLLNYL